MTTRDIFPNDPETCIHCGGGSDPQTPGRCDWCFDDDGRSIYLNCTVCDGPIVFDDTTPRLYCETHSDHELMKMAETYERDNGLPPLCVLDFLTELTAEGWAIRRTMRSRVRLPRREL